MEFAHLVSLEEGDVGVALSDMENRITSDTAAEAGSSSTDNDFIDELELDEVSFLW